ncbi:MAG: hypothetical protein M1114_00930 [Candidatus Dependentiae bacterium]|nr:hypothetical protein [Candidatus Dependentiae bacterium]
MKHFVGLCLFIATVSLHTATLPAENARRGMSIEEKINNLVHDIDGLYEDLDTITKELMKMKIWIVHHKDGSSAMHCKSIKDKPYIITKEEDWFPAMEACFEKNGFNNSEKWRATDLIHGHVRIYTTIIELEDELVRLRNGLKPALRHRTT